MKCLFGTIKSNYILKDIFSILSWNKKLEIIIYNKKLKEKIDINLEDYKNEIARYIQGERKEKGKEFRIGKNKVKFEGEYLNGKKNGKGKDYNLNGSLKFEGIYLKNKKKFKKRIWW